MKQSVCVNSLGIVKNHSSGASGPLVTANDVGRGGPNPSREDDRRGSLGDGRSGPRKNSPRNGGNHAGNSTESRKGREVGRLRGKSGALVPYPHWRGSFGKWLHVLG